MLQTAYELQTPTLLRATAGDAVVIKIRTRNRRATPIQASASAHGPDGWLVDKAEITLLSEPGETRIEKVTIRIPATEKIGEKIVAVAVKEGPLRKTLSTRLEIVELFSIEPVKLGHVPGDAGLKVQIRNRSLATHKVRLISQLPATWKGFPAEQKLALPASSTSEAQVTMSWNADWKPEESAQLLLVNDHDEILAKANVVPGLIPLYSIENVSFDGKLEDWPARNRLPDWSLTSNSGQADVTAFAGYSVEGLHLAFDVRRSAVKVTDPRQFWLQDCIEVFVDTANDKGDRREFGSGDHQFWLCPLTQENRVYVGRWRRFGEIPQTIYDLPTAKGFAAKSATGYVLEVLLPAAAMTGFSADKGKRIGFNLNLTIRGESLTREVFWPNEKGWNVLNMPRFWGVVELR